MSRSSFQCDMCIKTTRRTYRTYATPLYPSSLYRRQPPSFPKSFYVADLLLLSLMLAQISRLYSLYRRICLLRACLYSIGCFRRWVEPDPTDHLKVWFLSLLLAE